VVTFYPQEHVDEGRYKVVRCETRKRKTSYSFKGRFKKNNVTKVFFSCKKDNDVKVKLTQTTRGGCGKQNF
jgi:hypothetical protein